jgi:hypothetical protein
VVGPQKQGKSGYRRSDLRADQEKADDFTVIMEI